MPRSLSPDKIGEEKIFILFIRGFHVTSYEANLASHRTRDRHVGFLSP